MTLTLIIVILQWNSRVRLFLYCRISLIQNRAASRIENYENSGFTFTNQEEHKSIIVINRPDSAEEFIDTYNHEKNHVEMHICKEFGIDPYSEKAAYLSGQLAKKLFKAQLKNWIK